MDYLVGAVATCRVYHIHFQSFMIRVYILNTVNIPFITQLIFLWKAAVSYDVFQDFGSSWTYSYLENLAGAVACITYASRLS